MSPFRRMRMMAFYRRQLDAWHSTNLALNKLGMKIIVYAISEEGRLQWITP